MTHQIDDLVYIKGNPNDNTWYIAQILAIHGDYCWIIKRKQSRNYGEFVDGYDIRRHDGSNSYWTYTWAPETYEAKKCLKDLPANTKAKMKHI